MAEDIADPVASTTDEVVLAMLLMAALPSSEAELERSFKPFSAEVRAELAPP